MSKLENTSMLAEVCASEEFLFYIVYFVWPAVQKTKTFHLQWYETEKSKQIVLMFDIFSHARRQPLFQKNEANAEVL